MKSTRSQLIRSFVVAALVTLLAVTTVFAVQIGNHDVSFVQSQSDYPATDQSTWYYTITNLAYGSGSDISHLVMASCLQVATDPTSGALLAGTWDGVDPTSLNYGGGAPVWGLDPTTGFTGLKFDQGFNTPGEVRHYFFVVNGNPGQAPMTVAIKAGQDVFTGEVTGPSGSSGASCAPSAVALAGLSAQPAAAPALPLGMAVAALPVAAGAALTAAFVARRRTRSVTRSSVTD